MKSMTREEAIDILKNTIVRFGRINGKTAYAEALQMAIKALEEPPWIPCSERLPKDDTEVFVYLFNQPSPFIAWIEDTRWYTEEFEVDREDEPIAWMPLPEPWRGDAE